MVEPKECNFHRTVSELHEIVGKCSDNGKPILLAHSFGGTIALQYLNAHPESVERVILVCSPISYPLALMSLADRAKEFMNANKNTEGVAMLEKAMRADPASIEYAGSIFQAGLLSGAYGPHHPSDEAKRMYGSLGASPLNKWVFDMQPNEFEGFINNELYTKQDYIDLLIRHAARIVAVYGDEDWTITPELKKRMAGVLGNEKFLMIPNAGHAVFVDAPAQFVEAIQSLLADLDRTKSQ